MKKSQLSVIISSFLFSPLASAALVTSVTANQNRPAVVMSDDVLNSNDDSNAVYANGQNSTIDTNGLQLLQPEHAHSLLMLAMVVW